MDGYTQEEKVGVPEQLAFAIILAIIFTMGLWRYKKPQTYS